MGSDEWLTPPTILNMLGEFDLDPCSPKHRPWDTAKNHLTKADDGLSKKWYGRVWCNPPYGRETGKWLHRLVDLGNGIALIYARTETDMFFKYVWGEAHGVLFLKGRLHFYHVDGTRAKTNAGGPSVLVAYGENNGQILKHSGIVGRYIELR